MRQLFLFFLFCLSLLLVFSQEQQASPCYILYVKGDIRKLDGQKLVTGDTISVEEMTTLKFDSPGAMINLFEPSVGSFRMTEKEIISPKANHSFFEFLGHLLKVKGHPVSLSSRGDCVCIDPKPCLATDTAINNTVLLIDKITFNADPIIEKAERAFYFIQFGNQKRRLKVVNGLVELSPADFIFRDTSFVEGETPELTIGLYVKEAGNEHSDLVANVRFNIVSLTELLEYYKSLVKAKQMADLNLVKEIFTNDLYLFFGKPTTCQVDYIINSSKE